MIPVLDNDGMRGADAATIRGLGLPGLVLMESAASAVTQVVAARFAEAGRVLVVCGPGNNGGDGLAAARQLRCLGADVEVVLPLGADSLRGDAAKQLELARAFGVEVRGGGEGPVSAVEAALEGVAVVVDALFGTGLDRPLEGPLLEVVRLLNASGRPVVAVDVPSGLSGSRADVFGETVDAAVTVTFGAPKVAHVLPPACYRCGDVAVADIGIPPWVLEEHAALGVVEGIDVAGWMPRRAADAHKGHFGHLVVVAGRTGRAGAAALAARAGVVLGAGLVTVGTVAAAVAPLQALVPEAMVDVLPAGPDGTVSGEGLEGLLGKATAVAVGPGLGTGDGPRRLVEAMIRDWKGPLLLDADALTLIAGRLEIVAAREGATVLTPHPGELARVLGRETADVVRDRLGAAADAARLGGAVVLAKGARTVVAAPGRRTLINPTGSPGLASGGAGDTLTGLIGSLLAQGVEGREAAAAGAYLHGRAAELAEERFPGAIPAGELAGFVPAAEAEVRALL